MQSAAVGTSTKSFAVGEILPVSLPQSPAKFLRLAHLRQLKKCEKVAAVCYRVRPSGVQFLLVQTRRGRWTFPKGSVEPGLTHAQAAALEAFEEAGVHGRIQETAFTHYIHHKGRDAAASRIKVNAHLCEVLRLESPAERGRNRTWFEAGEAKARLREGRKTHHGAELARVVDRALVQLRGLAPEY